jgi:hypothetical protein
MQIKNPLLTFLSRAATDDRINANHICLFLAIYRSWDESHVNPLSVSRKQLMHYSKIASTATYHKCISDLNTSGYIRYEPSFHPKLGSKVYVL